MERKLAKLFLIIICSILFLLSTGHAANEINGNQNGGFSARLNNAKLSELTKSINESYGIDFKGPDDLFQSAISVSFENLKLEEMVKRILGGKNYVFKYDNRGNLTEVTLLPKSQNDMKARGAIMATSAKPPVAVVPPPPASQPTDPAASAVPGSPPVKEDQDNKEGQAPSDPSSSPEVPVPVPEQ